MSQFACFLQVLADGFFGSRGVVSSAVLGSALARSAARLPASTCGGICGVALLFVVAAFSPAARRLPLVVARFLAPVSLPVATAAFLQVLGAYYFWCQFCFSWRRLFVVCFRGLASEVARGSHQQASEQGAAPDRLQLRSLRSFLTPLSPLPAAGELVVMAQCKYAQLALVFAV